MQMKTVQTIQFEYLDALGVVEDKEAIELVAQEFNTTLSNATEIVYNWRGGKKMDIKELALKLCDAVEQAEVAMELLSSLLYDVGIANLRLQEAVGEEENND